MADAGYPSEDADFVEERTRAHMSIYRGDDIPELDKANHAARQVNRFLRNDEFAGLSANAERILREELLDDFDVDTISRSASADVRQELRERLGANDPDTYSLAHLFSAIRDIEKQAVAERYTNAMDRLDANSRLLVERMVKESLYGAKVIEVDYASLALDAPNHVRRMMTRIANTETVSISGPENVEVLEQTSSSGGFRIESQ